MKLTYFILFVSFYGHAQNPLEQAQQDLYSAKTIKDSIKAYQDIAWFSQTSSIETSFKYNKLAQKLIDKTGDKDASNTNLKELAGYVYRAGNYEKSISLFLEAQKRFEIAKDPLNVAKINANLATVYQTWTKKEKAMEYYIKALTFFEKDAQYNVTTAEMLTNIGIMYWSLGNQKDALNAYSRAEKLLTPLNNVIAMSNLKMNMGGLYVEQKKYDIAKDYLESSRELAIQGSNYVALAAVDHNLGSIALDLNNYDKAQTYFEEALTIKKQLGNPQSLAITELSLAILQTKQKKYDSAISNLYGAIATFEQNDNKDRLLKAYPAMQGAFIFKGQQDSAEVYYDKYTTVREGMEREKVAEVTMELDKKYQSEKKEKELAVQRAALLEKEIKLKQRNNLLLLLGLGLLFAVLLGYLFVRQQRLKNRQLQQENELNEAKAKLETEQKLQEQRLRISRDLHDNVGSQLTFVISSLDNLRYAKNVPAEITNDKLGSLSNFTRTTITELRDTIWAMNHDRISLAHLKERLTSQLSQAANAGVETVFKLDIDESLDESVSFSALKGMHIFRVIQEAVNNAMKYANSSLVHIGITEDMGNLKVSIQDNGGGFSKESVVMGNGLRNMQQRVDELEGTLEILSSADKGTTVLFKVPLK